MSRAERLCNLIMYVVLTLLLTLLLGGKNVDALGHLGGFITGVFAGLWLMPCHEQENARKARAATIGFWFKIITAIWFASLLLFFFTLREPKEISVSAASLSTKENQTTPAPPAPAGDETNTAQIDAINLA